MSIRDYNKDHIAERRENPTSSAQLVHEQSSLTFWTLHSKPINVDMTVFSTGETHQKSRGLWNGPFTGRPILIMQLLPAIRSTTEFASPQTTSRLLATLRTWWRLFDEVENVKEILKVTKVADIGEVHRQFAIDKDIDHNHFQKLLQLINITRIALGLRQLYWIAPATKKPIRKIATASHFNQIRFLIKHQWYDTLDRWRRADELMDGQRPNTSAEEKLRTGYLLLKSAIISSGKAKPDRHDIRGTISYGEFNERGKGHIVEELLRGFYPNSFDIRNAFHLCLATTGWNAAVLLSIDANEDFIEPHPKDPSRYLMRGFKERGKSEPIAEGLFKSEGSACFVMKTIISRTGPLRDALRQQLQELRASAINCNHQAPTTRELNNLRRRILQLEEGIKSPWLYVSGVSKDILWLDDYNYSKTGSKGGPATFLDKCIESQNTNRATEHKIARIKPGDMRDAFAEHAYRVSGGCILFVMRALGHRHASTTIRYIDNNIINGESKRIYRAFSNSLWHEIKVHQRCDPTIIAKWSQDGAVSSLDRERLGEYRAARTQRSRIGIICRDPLHPPPHIAPAFKADGKAMCPVQRCMLCLEHAIIVPESLDGLCKRLAELEYIRGQISMVSYLESSFPLEMENTKIALSAFDASQVSSHINAWTQAIANGTHFIPL